MQCFNGKLNKSEIKERLTTANRSFITIFISFLLFPSLAKKRQIEKRGWQFQTSDFENVYAIIKNLLFAVDRYAIESFLGN